MWSDVGRLLILAAIGEAVWQTLKLVWEPNANRKLGKFHPDKIGALAVGILIAFGSGLDLPAMVGIPMSIPYLGIILTGVLISRGAGFVHDLLTYLNSLKEIVLNKADTANFERTALLKVNGAALPKGSKIDLDIPREVPGKGSFTPRDVMDKTKEMLVNAAGTAQRVVKVIHSSPAIKIEVPAKATAEHVGSTIKDKSLEGPPIDVLGGETEESPASEVDELKKPVTD